MFHNALHFATFATDVLTKYGGTCAGAAGIGILGWRSWNWTMRGRARKLRIQEEEIQKAQRNQGIYEIRSSEAIEDEVGNGEIAFGIVGSFGTGLLPDLLRNFQAVGGSSLVGGVLLAQLTSTERFSCFREIDPIFGSRVTLLNCQKLPGGFHGATYEEALNMRHLWFNDLVEAVHEWMRYLDRQATELLILFVSPGGHLALVPTIVDLFKERYPDKPVYIITILDRKEVVRERFPIVRKLVAATGKVRGMIIMDNLRAQARSDRGITTLIPALAAGSWSSRSPDQLANVLSYIFATTRRPRYATISVWAESLPVTVTGGSPHALLALVEEKITRGIKTLVENKEWQSLPLDAAPLGHARYIEVVVPLLPGEFTRLSRRIDTNLDQWRQDTDTEIQINYASIAYPVDNSTTDVPILVIFLQPLADEGTGIDDYATTQRSAMLLPKPLTQALADQTERTHQ